MKKNSYSCICGNTINTANFNDGVTPFMIHCNVCGGSARSHFFSVNQNLKPDLYWFSPSDKQLKKQVVWELSFCDAKDVMSAKEAYKLNKKHVGQGGLVLAPDIKTIKEWGL